jgi:hypothetical protein
MSRHPSGHPKAPQHNFHKRLMQPRLPRVLRELRVDPRKALKKTCASEF